MWWPSLANRAGKNYRSVLILCWIIYLPESLSYFFVDCLQDHLLWDSSRAPDDRRLQQLVKASGCNVVNPVFGNSTTMALIYLYIRGI